MCSTELSWICEKQRQTHIAYNLSCKATPSPSKQLNGSHGTVGFQHLTYMQIGAAERLSSVECKMRFVNKKRKQSCCGRNFAFLLWERTSCMNPIHIVQAFVLLPQLSKLLSFFRFSTWLFLFVFIVMFATIKVHNIRLLMPPGLFFHIGCCRSFNSGSTNQLRSSSGRL